MKTSGLTGGIGSGKSTVASLLVERGAVLIDADQIAREVVAPGAEAYGPLVERFGPVILDREGQVDRAVLAGIVFADPGALADLNAITHPAIGAEMLRRLEAERSRASLVILDVPLLRPLHRDAFGLDSVVVVDCDPALALDRLVRYRSMDRLDAARRISAQPSRAERLAGADFVVDNSGPLDALEPQVDRLWTYLQP